MKRSAYFALFLSGISNDVESFQPSSSHFARRTALHAAVNGDSDAKKRVVVIGNGMVGQRFMENLIDLDKDKTCTISTFCEEPRAAYNRVKLTSYFETRDPSALSMTSEFDKDGRTPWYEENNVELLLNDKAVSIDTQSKTIVGASGKTLDYDVAVVATGSFPFVPPIPGRQRPGVFVYRVSDRSFAPLFPMFCIRYYASRHINKSPSPHSMTDDRRSREHARVRQGEPCPERRRHRRRAARSRGREGRRRHECQVAHYRVRAHPHVSSGRTHAVVDLLPVLFQSYAVGIVLTNLRRRFLILSHRSIKAATTPS